ncbi:MAG: hypothetical protein ACTH3D_11235 [Halomonas sp.]|uniref:hypothetical protein n=1 Tax=Halomonas sp. TaxID=1486246 RepID=UPI003F8F2DD4
MSVQNTISGEKYPHKITAEYASQSAADTSAKRLVDDFGLSPSQVLVVRPHDPDVARKVEPESSGIAKTMARSHVTLGLAGLFVGLVVAGILVVFGPVATQSSPMLTFIALGFLGAVLALLLAGAVSLRPDHGRVVQKTREATDSGKWTVVVHCADTEQQDRVKNAVDHSVQTL